MSIQLLIKIIKKINKLSLVHNLWKMLQKEGLLKINEYLNILVL